MLNVSLSVPLSLLHWHSVFCSYLRIHRCIVSYASWSNVPPHCVETVCLYEALSSPPPCLTLSWLLLDIIIRKISLSCLLQPSSDIRPHLCLLGKRWCSFWQVKILIWKPVCCPHCRHQKYLLWYDLEYNSLDAFLLMEIIDISLFFKWPSPHSWAPTPT